MSKIQFRGFVFGGYQNFPPGVLENIDATRKWALESGALTEPDLQLITKDKMSELEKVFSADDELLVMCDLHKYEDGKLAYFEYPFVPVKTLIKKGLKIKLVYWTNSTLEMTFGFWLDGNTLEYASTTSGKLTLEKFGALFRQLENKYPIKDVSGQNGQTEKEIEVDGNVSALFSKSGRAFDVQLTVGN